MAGSDLCFAPLPRGPVLLYREQYTLLATDLSPAELASQEVLARGDSQSLLCPACPPVSQGELRAICFASFWS
jgi:hypothetical protein